MKAVLSAVLCLIFFGACGVEDEKNNSGNENPPNGNSKPTIDNSLELVPSKDKLPECKEGLIGKVFYIQDTDSFQVCIASGWADIDLSGAKGAPGPQGEQGPQGPKGDAGEDGLDGTINYLPVYDASNNIIVYITEALTSTGPFLVKHPTENRHSGYYFYTGSGLTFAKRTNPPKIYLSTIFVYSSSDCSGQPYVSKPLDSFIEAYVKLDNMYFAGFPGNGSYGDSSGMEIQLSSLSPSNFTYNSYHKCDVGDTCTTVADLICVVETDGGAADWYPITISAAASYFQGKLNAGWRIEY